ncbi:MAG: hypothetical protein ABSG97_08790 [Sedimentisphaerales bacterium]|jgi:hypothetical protein
MSNDLSGLIGFGYEPTALFLFPQKFTRRRRGLPAKVSSPVQLPVRCLESLVQRLKRLDYYLQKGIFKITSAGGQKAQRAWLRSQVFDMGNHRQKGRVEKRLYHYAPHGYGILSQARAFSRAKK